MLDNDYSYNGLLTYLSVILVSTSNDVQTNPGAPTNESAVYPCGTCYQPVTWDHRAVVYDTCDQWYHISCQDVYSGTYSILNEYCVIRWDCPICNKPNYNLTCHDSTPSLLRTLSVYCLSATPTSPARTNAATPNQFIPLPSQ